MFRLVKVIFFGVVLVVKVLFKCVVLFGWRLCSWWSWCSGEGCWFGRFMEVLRDIRNRIVLIIFMRLVLNRRDFNKVIVLFENEVMKIWELILDSKMKKIIF